MKLNAKTIAIAALGIFLVARYLGNKTGGMGTPAPRRDAPRQMDINGQSNYWGTE